MDGAADGQEGVNGRESAYGVPVQVRLRDGARGVRPEFEKRRLDELRVREAEAGLREAAGEGQRPGGGVRPGRRRLDVRQGGGEGSFCDGEVALWVMM